MFTANSMNCLTEALGLSLPGNGTIVATHVNRRRLFEDAAALIVRNAERYYFEGDERVLPRSIATKAAFENAMSLDIAMGGSTNTVLHLLAEHSSSFNSLLAHTGCNFSGSHTIVILNPPSLDFRLSFFRISSLSLANICACLFSAPILFNQ